MEGRTTSKGGMEIDRASAANVRRAKEDIDADKEEEDVFGYTTSEYTQPLFIFYYKLFLLLFFLNKYVYEKEELLYKDFYKEKKYCDETHIYKRIQHRHSTYIFSIIIIIISYETSKEKFRCKFLNRCDTQSSQGLFSLIVQKVDNYKMSKDSVINSCVEQEYCFYAD